MRVKNRVNTNMIVNVHDNCDIFVLFVNLVEEHVIGELGHIGKSGPGHKHKQM